MDPLSVQMAMGSPPMLRGKISLSNLIAQKKRSPASDKTSSTRTPTKLGKIDETPKQTPSTPTTVRTRRGFRPLSVLTNSVLFPFEFDALKAMKELEEADKKAAASNSTDKETHQANPKTQFGPARSSFDSSNALATLPLSNESEISLRAFLAQSSWPANSSQKVKGPFPTLYQIPAPDISQHPSNSPNPFESQSDSPTLITTSSSAEIKQYAAQARHSLSYFTDRTSTGSDAFGSTDKKKFTFFEKLQTPTSPTARRSTTITDHSPLAKRHPKSCPIEISYAPLEAVSPETEKRRMASESIRKISGIFKTRVGSEKIASPSTASEETSGQSPRAGLVRLEEYLRKVTCSPTYHYTDTSWLPRHPNTGRFWRSRNLKCTNCVDVSCACCGRTCCAFKAAVMALETHKDNTDGRKEALERIQQITLVFPYGRETPTFLQCTADVDNGTGCGKLVCPECCGVCPDEICGDIQCRKCKRNPWAECDWHANMMVGRQG